MIIKMMSLRSRQWNFTRNLTLEAVEDQEAKVVDEAMAEDSKAEGAEDNTITGVVGASLLVAVATTTITCSMKAAITTSIMEAIAVVVVVKSRGLKISKDNRLVPLLVMVA